MQGGNLEKDTDGERLEDRQSGRNSGRVGNVNAKGNENGNGTEDVSSTTDTHRLELEHPLLSCLSLCY